jgi:SAM-dependent methyltransferase
MRSAGNRDLYGRDYEFYARARDTGPRSIAYWSSRFYAGLVRRRAPGGGRVLEIGCGLGGVLRHLESDHRTSGVDLSSFALARARHDLARSGLAAAEATELPFRGQTFDAVLAKHVLEHLADPAAALAELARVLRSPGGLLVYGTPNADNPLRALKGNDWIGVKDPTHVSVLSPAKWLELTAASGFEIERAFSDGFWDVPYLRAVPAFVQLALFALPAAVQVLAGRPLVPMRYGESLIVIARRR